MTHYPNIKKDFINSKENIKQLKIVNRKTPIDSDLFFQKLYKSFNSVMGFVHKKSAKEDIHKLLDKQFSSNVKSNPFYDKWVDDMSYVCKIFSDFLEEEKVSFWVGSKRGCKRYHVDMVPFRLLVTYSGQGTELLPDEAANRTAFVEGSPNEKIIKEKSGIKFINKWDIALFRGGHEGILHRTPDSAMNDQSSILMRLDNSALLEDIQIMNDI